MKNLLSNIFGVVAISLKVGPPRNVTVVQTDEGDEFVVSWIPPEYGLEFLRVYVVRHIWNLKYFSSNLPFYLLNGSWIFSINHHIR